MFLFKFYTINAGFYNGNKNYTEIKVLIVDPSTNLWVYYWHRYFCKVTSAEWRVKRIRVLAGMWMPNCSNKRMVSMCQQTNPWIKKRRETLRRSGSDM